MTSTYTAITNAADLGKIVIMNNDHVTLRRPLCSPSLPDDLTTVSIIMTHRSNVFE